MPSQTLLSSAGTRGSLQPKVKGRRRWLEMGQRAQELSRSQRSDIALPDTAVDRQGTGEHVKERTAPPCPKERKFRRCPARWWEFEAVITPYRHWSRLVASSVRARCEQCRRVAKRKTNPACPLSSGTSQHHAVQERPVTISNGTGHATSRGSSRMRAADRTASAQILPYSLSSPRSSWVAVYLCSPRPGASLHSNLAAVHLPYTDARRGHCPHAISLPSDCTSSPPKSPCLSLPTG